MKEKRFFPIERALTGGTYVIIHNIIKCCISHYTSIPIKLGEAHLFVALIPIENNKERGDPPRSAVTRAELH